MFQWGPTGGAIAGAIILAIELAIIVSALIVLPGNRRPQTAMAWLLLIIGLPFLGFLLFLLFGRTTVGKKRRALQEEVNEAILAAAHLEDLEDEEQRLELPPLVRTFARLNRRLGVLPLSFGNTVELIEDYQVQIDAMTAEVATATDYIHVQFYISS